MDISHIPLFAALSKRMDWINQRQTVLAENIANVDTPGYAAQDLKQPDFGQMVAATSMKLTLLTSEPGHLNSSSQGPDFQTLTSEAARSPSGNNVQLDEQAMKVSQNASDFSLMETLYRAQLGLMKMALGSGSGSGS